MKNGPKLENSRRGREGSELSPPADFDLEKEHTREQGEEFSGESSERNARGKKSKRRKEKWREPNAAPMVMAEAVKGSKGGVRGFRTSVLPPFMEGCERIHLNKCARICLQKQY